MMHVLCRYLVEINWWNQWKDYVRYDENDGLHKSRKSPGVIDNSGLLTDEGMADSKVLCSYCAFRMGSF